MGYLPFFINFIALETVDFYNSEEYAGTSTVPFMGFMLFVVGLVVLIVGAATYLTAKHNFNIFYDQRDAKITYDEQQMDEDERFKKNQAKLVRDKKIGIIVLVVGAVLVVASFIVL